MKNCIVCNIEFEETKSNQIFCCSKCKWKYYNKKKNKGVRINRKENKEVIGIDDIYYKLYRAQEDRNRIFSELLDSKILTKTSKWIEVTTL